MCACKMSPRTVVTPNYNCCLTAVAFQAAFVLSALNPRCGTPHIMASYPAARFSGLRAPQGSRGFAHPKYLDMRYVGFLD